MARPVGANSVIEVSVVGHLAGQRTLNVLHYRVASVAPDATVPFEPLVDMWQDNHWDSDALGTIGRAYRDCISNQWEQLYIRYQIIYPVRFSFIARPTITEGGHIEEAAMPPNVTAVVGKRNDATGRRNRGSIHLPGVPVSMVEDGRLVNDYRLLLSQLGQRLIQPLTLTADGTSATLEPVIIHRSGANASAPFTDYTVESEARILRRRTVGVGE